MNPSVVLLSTADRRASELARLRAEANLKKVNDAAEKIKHMTELYRQRLEGTLK